jgi:uncharacterized membrane protein YhaH (DUF805 family)
MGFGTAIQAFWQNYANFTGRARRSEYWFIQLFLVLTNLAAAVIDLVLMRGDVERFIANGGGGIVGLIWILITIVPALAVLVRRLHDTSRSGWWALLTLLPVIGGTLLLVSSVSAWWPLLVGVPLVASIVVFVFTLLDSTEGENTYGASPKVSPQTPDN